MDSPKSFLGSKFWSMLLTGDYYLGAGDITIVVLIFTLLWTICHQLNLGFRLCRSVLPEDAKRTFDLEIEKSPVTKLSAEINGTAFLHSIVTVPLSVFCVVLLWGNPFFSTSAWAQLSCLLMMGYFIWDTVICAIHFKIFGLAFLLHAVLSLLAGVLQVASRHSVPMQWIGACFCATEISTPFLHLRWFILKAKHTNSFLFQVVNFLFLFVFTVYRLCLCEYWAAIPLITEVVNPKYMVGTRRLIGCGQVLILLLWMALNYYWGILLLTSQVKQLFSSKKRIDPLERRDHKQVE